jgi:hypothetical protein
MNLMYKMINMTQMRISIAICNMLNFFDDQCIS